MSAMNTATQDIRGNSMQYKIMLTDSAHMDISIEMLEFTKINAEIVRPKDMSKESLLETGHDCDAILCDYALIDNDVIKGLTQCKIIAVAGIGVNTIDLVAATQKGIKVSNVPDYCLCEVAEHAMALFLACVRKIPLYDQAVRKGLWHSVEYAPISRIAGKKFGLFGFGSIAQKLAARAQAFEMQVYAYDPFQSDEVFARCNVEKAESLEQLATLVDVFSIHTPLTDATSGSVNHKIFTLMKPHCIVLNTSRGGVVVEQDLIEALMSGEIAAAGLDVLQTEPPNKDNPLFAMQNVVLTPHCAFYSEDSDAESRDRRAKDVVRTLLGGDPVSWVNKGDFIGITL